MAGPNILVVRLGAMGDIIHTLPAVASLKHSNPYSRITWLVESKWAPLLDGNPYVERLVMLDRRSVGSVRTAWREVRSWRYDIAVDFQGLLKSAFAAACSRAEKIYGFQHPRESLASWFYSSRVAAASTHVVDRNLDLAAAAGASNRVGAFPIPAGQPEGTLPAGAFVLACPAAGWGSKQWPLDYYSALGERLMGGTGMPLVLNGPKPVQVRHAVSHVSGLPGLIDATRRAAAVVGLDSGPLHLAAALGKPGVAIFGPTDPARNGPYRSTMAVLRTPGVETTYRRNGEPDRSMLAITPDMVFQALLAVLSHGRPR